MNISKMVCSVCKTQMAGLTPLDPANPKFVEGAANILVCMTCLTPNLVDLKEEKIFPLTPDLLDHIRQINPKAYGDIIETVKIARHKTKPDLNPN